MGLKEEIKAYLDKHEGEMTADIMALCSIPSVKGEAMDGMPYGEKPCEALNKAAEICSGHGFKVKNYDNYVIAADMNYGAHTLDILAHMDVVAAGEGWTVTEPFAPVIKDGKIFGRGSSDDKGPAMAALYAMRAVKELGIPVSKNCRLILGSDEECGSSDIAYYYEKEPEAPMTFSPDAEFPLVNIEKGQFRFNVTARFEKSSGGASLINLNGGDTTNIVPGRAKLTVSGLSMAEVGSCAEEIMARTGVLFNMKKENVFEGDGGKIEVEVIGKTAHASAPGDGRNAAVAALLLAAGLPLADCPQVRAIKKLSELFPYGDHLGKAIGCDRRDASGDTTVSLNIIKIDSESLYARADSRTCASADEENTIIPAEERIREEGFDVETSFRPPHIVDEDSEFIRTLNACYEEATGEPGRCVAVGGGTYVHELKNGVAFGAVAEGTNTNMHGADEFVIIEEMKTAALIYALAIARLCA